MKYLFAILFILMISIPKAEANIKYFNINTHWTKITGWCFTSTWRKLKLPDFIKIHICMPKRWDAVDVCILQRMEIGKDTYIMVGHKVTYSNLIYEFLKIKENWAHGPYVFLDIKF